MGQLTNKVETLNERIKELRKNKGMTQLELAKKVHVTDKAVSKWETGEGNPEISILIELAKIFEVSLDYLLKGKETAPEIVIMSKMEFCCKEDNENLFNEISSEILKGKDENGNNILDYIEKYDSKKIYNALINKLIPSSSVNNSFSGFKNFETKRVMELLYKYDDVSSLEKINFFNHLLSRNSYGSIRLPYYKISNIYDEKNVEIMMSLIPDNSVILTKALTLHIGETVNNVSNWQAVYNNILYYALLNDKKIAIEKTINTILEINKTSIELYEKKLQECRNYYEKKYTLSLKPRSIDSYHYYAVIAVPVNILELLINKGYVNEVKQLNEYNAKFEADTISTGLINAAIMKQKGKHSDDDIYIVSCMEYGIVNIDKLLKCNDLNLVKKAFLKYPLCFEDMMAQLLSEKKYKEIFIYSVDNGFDLLAEAILLIKTENYGVSYVESKISDLVETIYKNENKYDVNKNHYIKKPERGYYHRSVKPRKTTQEVIDEIIQDLTLKFDKENTIKDLTKKYFERLLKNNNLELLIIKLCVKFEAILRCDYRYEGNFEEMINKYCKAHLEWEDDDGWGGRDIKTIELLNKLRIKRNSIVHSEKTQVDLSLDDLKYCIEYISKLNKEA